MWIFQLNRFFQNSLRLLTILFIIIKHAIRNWLFNRGIARRLLDPKGKRLTTRSERIRQMIEDLGPTFIKFGQIIADRPDLVSEQLRNELKKLQSSARPFDNQHAFRLMEEELGDPMDEVFSHIEQKPIASASIAQVYKAVLTTGETVAVKLQRPGIRQKIKLDLALMRILAQNAVKSYPELASFNVVGFVEDFGAILMKELDFTNEAANMLRFSEMFKYDDRCYIPKVFSRYTTQKLLVMEFVTGLPPDDIKKIKANGYNPQALAENGMHILMKMILRHGFFHADPHVGNIMVGKNNQVILLDHGMAASLKPNQIQSLINFILGFAREDARRITKSLLGLLEINYYKNQDDLEFDISELIQKYNYISYEKMDFSVLLSDCFTIIIHHGLKVPSNLFMLLKALGTIQKFAEYLEADVSLTNMIKPYAAEKIKEQFSWNTVSNKLINSAEDYLYLIDRFPRDVKEIVSNLKKGVLRHEINFREDSFTNKALRQNINRLAFVFIMGLMLICSTLLMIYQPDKTIIRVFFYTSITAVFWTAFRLLLKTKFG